MNFFCKIFETIPTPNMHKYPNQRMLPDTQKQNITFIVAKYPHQIEQIPSTRTEPQKIYNHINKQSDMFGSALIPSKCA